MKKPAQKKKNTVNNNNQTSYQKPYMVVPYYKGLSESVKRTCNKHGVQVYFRGGVTIKNLLMDSQGPGSNAEKEWGHL